jgi:hypothetical protein
MSDIALHQHGKTEHTHAWATVPHTHVLRAVCLREECEGHVTHNIHPDADDHRQKARERAGAEGIGY